MSISSAITFMWMAQDPTDDKSTLVQVMAWWRQAPFHYLSQCWPWFVVPYDMTRPQWVNWNLEMDKHSYLLSYVGCNYSSMCKNYLPPCFPPGPYHFPHSYPEFLGNLFPVMFIIFFRKLEKLRVFRAGPTSHVDGWVSHISPHQLTVTSGVVTLELERSVELIWVWWYGLVIDFKTQRPFHRLMG